MTVAIVFALFPPWPWNVATVVTGVVAEIGEIVRAAGWLVPLVARARSDPDRRYHGSDPRPAAGDALDSKLAAACLDAIP
jgi:hypothetical protein